MPTINSFRDFAQIGPSQECRLMNLLGTILSVERGTWGVAGAADAGVLEMAESTTMGVEAGGSNKPTAGLSRTTITALHCHLHYRITDTKLW